MAIWPVQDRAMRARSRALGVLFVGVIFLGLLVRLVFLQLIQGDWYRERAEGQQLRDTVVPADRGEIFSREGVLLATSASCWTIRASPREIADDRVEATARAMADILELDYDSVLEKFSQRSSNDCLLKRRVDKITADAVRLWCVENEGTGILINQDTKRWYPQGSLLATVLGFTNVDNAGMGGLELQYDEQLTGTDGVVLTQSNAWGYTMENDYSTAIAAVPGNSLTLTIDYHIQNYLESALAYAITEHNVANRAIGIMMDVNTGAVLAMAVVPSYDPNQPRVLADAGAQAAVDALEGQARAEALSLAQQTQWRNKCISDLYEPGSVFKLITCSSALDAGAVTPDSTFSCGAYYSVSGTRFHCANNKRHGVENLTQALENSCNQAFIQVGARLGREKFCEYFERYGLRGATGIDLPGEAKRTEYYTAEKMGPVELASCSFGQSSKITYIGMLRAACAVVNGGKLLQPYLVDEIRDAEGNCVSKTEPQVLAQVISPEVSAQMRTMMESVVVNGGGKNAQVAGYRIGGKSGTSQKLDSDEENVYISSFLSVAPIDAPQVALLICLDEAHSWSHTGGSLCAPICAEVMEKTLQYLGVPRSISEEEAEAAATEPVEVDD